ncbi:Eukaryotic translation initiation factor eIF-1 [Coemansia sp. RSA 678]|nr:Eukaryotic translation initiation factor eIF-1 [Coemansia sp. RSA 678]
MSQSKVENKNVDVNSSDEGTTPKLVKDNESEISDFSDSDNEEVTKKSKKGKPVEKFDDIEFSASLDPFGSGANDPFAEDKKKESSVAAKFIHIRLQLRNARKSTTTLQGLPEEFDLKKLLKFFKKTFGCLGTIVNDDDFGKVIQLSGDQRAKLSEFLVSEGIAKKGDIKVHGF